MELWGCCEAPVGRVAAVPAFCQGRVSRLAGNRSLSGCSCPLYGPRLGDARWLRPPVSRRCAPRWAERADPGVGRRMGRAWVSGRRKAWWRAGRERQQTEVERFGEGGHDHSSRLETGGSSTSRWSYRRRLTRLIRFGRRRTCGGGVGRFLRVRMLWTTSSVACRAPATAVARVSTSVMQNPFQGAGNVLPRATKEGQDEPMGVGALSGSGPTRHESSGPGFLASR